MKPILTLLTFLLFTGTYAQYCGQHFNRGNREEAAADCWYTPGCSLVNGAGEVLEGSHSARTGQLSGGLANANGVVSPWIRVGSGNITFQHRLTNWNAGSTRFIMVTMETAGTPPIRDTIYRVAYEPGNATNTQFVTIHIPAYAEGMVCRFKFLAYGTGGNSRCLMDNIKIKGDYWSCPAKGCVPLPNRVDADHDGISDEEDVYPNDPNKAFESRYPTTGNGTLLFEDLWPANGDNDFNDLVLYYNYTVVSNASNQVVEVKYNFIPQAIGGSFRNGFAFQLDGINAAQVIRTIRSRQPGTMFQLSSNGTESAQSLANIPIFSSAQDLLPSSGGGIGVNINPNAPFVTPETIQVTVVFQENGRTAPGQAAIASPAIHSTSFNPYLIINGERGKEIHCADRKPTSLASAAFFNTSDDRSNAASNRYYKNRNNLPWILNVPAIIPYSKEGKDITSIYLKLIPWALSGGAQYNDWYLDKPGYRSSTNAYSH